MISQTYSTIKKQTLILFFIALSLNALSQNKQIQIKGFVLDLIHNKPIKNATISIYQYNVDYTKNGEPILNATKTSKLLTIVSSNSEGHFSSEIKLRKTTDYIHLVIENSNTETYYKNHIKVEINKDLEITLLLTPLHLNKTQELLLEKKSYNNYKTKEKEKMIDYDKRNKEIKSITPLNKTTSSSRSSNSCSYSSIPTTVYVSNLHNGYNSASSTTSGYTGYINFDDYVAGVVQAEIGGITTNIETKKAQAVAARTFSMHRHLNGLAVNIGQAYNDSPTVTSLTSSNATNAQIILYNGNVIDAKYSARCNGDYTQNATEGTWAPYNNCNTSGNPIPYLISRPCSGHDNCSKFGETPCCNVTISTSNSSGYIYGHGVGMCQRGIEQWGEIYNINYCDMLNKYYTDICITNTNCGDSSNVLDCSNAVTLNCGITYTGSASSENSKVNTYGCNDWSETGPERIHSFTATSNGELTAKISNFTGDLDVYILGSCNPSDCLGTVSSDSATYPNAQAGHTYYIIVDSDDGSGSAYDIIVNCASSNIPNLQYHDHSIVDKIGLTGVLNENNKAEPGENIDLKLALYNSSSVAINTIKVILSTNDPDITIRKNEVLFETIPAESSKNASYFNFDISSTCQNKDIDFSLDITSNEGTWTDSFSLTVHNNLSITNKPFKESIKLFPNPTKGVINYHVDYYKIKFIQVYDSKSMPMPFETNQNNNIIDISKLPSGIYFFKFTNYDSQNALFKIIKR